jgi:hypothetical protein
MYHQCRNCSRTGDEKTDQGGAGVQARPDGLGVGPGAAASWSTMALFRLPATLRMEAANLHAAPPAAAWR